MRSAPLLPALLLAACSSVSTSHDYDVSYDFGKLKDWAWARVPDRPDDNPLVRERVRSAVEAELRAKGYAPAARDADFLVAAYIGRRSRIQVTDWGYGYGPPGVWRGGNVDVYEYEEGTIIVDIVDSASRSLVWRGSATGIIDPGATPEERTEEIREAVAKILAKFPPGK